MTSRRRRNPPRTDLPDPSDRLPVEQPIGDSVIGSDPLPARTERSRIRPDSPTGPPTKKTPGKGRKKASPSARSRKPTAKAASTANVPTGAARPPRHKRVKRKTAAPLDTARPVDRPTASILPDSTDPRPAQPAVSPPAAAAPSRETALARKIRTATNALGRRGLVFLVDDDADVRSALEFMLSSGGYAVVPFESAESYLIHSNQSLPYCLLLDERMPGMTGMQLLEQLKSRPLIPAVVFLTAYADVQMTVRAMKRGAVNVLEKLPTLEQLFRTVDEALVKARQTWADYALWQTLQSDLELLTDRELEVMELIVKGEPSSREIAQALGISNRTADKHRSNVLAKLNSRSTTDVVRKVMQYRELCSRFEPRLDSTSGE